MSAEFFTIPGKDRDPRSEVLAQEQINRLLVAIEHPSFPLQQVVRARYVDGLSFDQIGKQLNQRQLERTSDGD